MEPIEKGMMLSMIIAIAIKLKIKPKELVEIFLDKAKVTNFQKEMATCAIKKMIDRMKEPETKITKKVVKKTKK